MRLGRFFVIMVLTLNTIAAMAQPVEYQKIFDLIKSPDELVSAEFSTAGRNSIFSVEMFSAKNLQVLSDLFKEGASLDLISADFSEGNRWKLFLTNAKSAPPSMQKFEEIVSMPWKNKDGQFSSFSLTKTEISATTFPGSPEELAQNLEMAATAGMKFSGSTPAQDSSSAVFSLNLASNWSETMKSSIQEDKVGAEFAKFGKLLKRNDLNYAIEYKLEAQISLINRLISIPGEYNKSLHSISVSCRDGKAALITMKVSNIKKETSNKKRILKILLQRNTFLWATESFNPTTPVLTGFETDFGGKITLTGISPKSSLIFSQFFPMILRNIELRNPFFSRGTYKETKFGRVMLFRVDCDW